MSTQEPRPDAGSGATGAGAGAGSLEALEQELTREVPNLLEHMNRTSAEVNLFERQGSEAEERYQELLAQWSQLYESLHSQYGGTIDRVKPYFDAAQVFNATSQRVQGAVREFSAASSQHSTAKAELRALEAQLAQRAHQVTLDREQQDGLSRATVRVLKCQQERDRREQEYVRALREYQEAQEALEAWRTQIGDATIKRTLPCFRQLHQQQLKLASEQNRINAFVERARAAKSLYNNSIRELDRINIAVHQARKQHAAKGQQAPEVVLQPAPEATPEQVPEKEREASLAPEEAYVFGDVDEISKDQAYLVTPRGLSARKSLKAEDVDEGGPFA